VWRPEVGEVIEHIIVRPDLPFVTLPSVRTAKKTSPVSSITYLKNVPTARTLVSSGRNSRKFDLREIGEVEQVEGEWRPSASAARARR
jgi:hypothetical protein